MQALTTTPNEEKAAAVTSYDGLNFNSTTHLSKETGSVLYHDETLARKRT